MSLFSGPIAICTNVFSFYDPDQGSRRLLGEDGNVLSDSEDIFSKMGMSRISRKYKKGLSSSDAEVDYRRGRSLREGRGDFAWQY